MNSKAIINIVDSLDSTSTTDALSANQGRILKELVNGNLNVEEFTHSDRTIVLHLSNGLLIQTGNTIITPEEENTRTFKTITFPKSYDEIPIVLVSLATAYPSVIKAACSANTTTQATFVLDRDTISNTAIRWFAIGYKSIEE